MAAGYGIRITGLNKVVRGLREFGVTLDELRPAFSDLADDAKGLIQTQTPKRTGRLAGSLRSSKSATRAVVRAGGAARPYAGPINYGWPSRGIAPSLFMQKGSEQIEPKVVPRLEKELNEIARRAGIRME